MALNSSDEALEILDKALQELSKNTALSKDTLNKINAALGKTTEVEKENADAVKKNTSTIKELTSALVSATKTAIDVGQSVRDNREDFTSLNPAIQATGDILKAGTNALGGTLEAAGESVSGLGGSSKKASAGLNVLGAALKGIGKITKTGGAALSELGVAYSQFAVGELQNVVTSFREVGSVGAIGTQGMTGLYDQATQAGISIGQFSKVVSENGPGLALAAGSTETGAKALAKLAENSKPFQREMLGLGYGISEQREYQARFLKYNRLVGQIDMKNDKDLSQASRQYMENLDMLSRLTGKSRDALAKEMDDRLSNVRYQASLQKIEAEGGAEARKQVDNTAAMLQSYIPEAAKGFQEGWENSATEAGQAFDRMFGDVGQAVREGLKSGKLKAGEATIMLRDELIRRQKDMGTAEVARLAGLGGPFNSLATAMQQASTARNLTREELEKAANSQGKAKKAQDKTTGEVIDAQESLQQMTNQMDKIVKENVLPNAAKYVKSYTQALETFVSWANKSMGTAETGETEGGGGVPSGGGAAAAQSTSAAEDMAWGGTNVAGMGTAAVPSDISGDKPGGAAGGGSTQQILDTIKSKESGGNYQAQAKGSSASGAYQFTDSTWQGLTKKYGIGAEFAKAKDAPQQIQDAVAAKYVDELMKKAGGDVSKIPLAWYTGNLQGKMSDQAIALNAGLTPEKYQEKWMSQYNKMASAGAVAGGSVQPTTVAEAPIQVPAGRPGSPSANIAARQAREAAQAQEKLTTVASAGNTQRDEAYLAEVRKISDQEARLAAAKERVMEARKQMAYKNPNGKIIVQSGEPFAAQGGVFSGPKTGYNATLHGNEAVVPLPSGDKIPVEMGGISDLFDEQVSIMTSQIERMDELVKLLRTGTDISNRILRVSQV